MNAPFGQYQLQRLDSDVVDVSGTKHPVQFFGTQWFEIFHEEFPQFENIVAGKSVATFQKNGGSTHQLSFNSCAEATRTRAHYQHIAIFRDSTFDRKDMGVKRFKSNLKYSLAVIIPIE